MNYVNVAMIEGHMGAIAASHDWQSLIELIDEYFGPDSERLAWNVHNAKYPSEYAGYFEYRDGEDGKVYKVKVYEVDFK